MSDDSERPNCRPPRRLVTAAYLVPLSAAAYGLIYRTAPFTPWEEVWLPAGVGGAAIGCLYWHSYRGLGFTAFLTLGASLAGFWGWSAGFWRESAIWIASALLGFVLARLAFYLARFRIGSRWALWFFLAVAVGTLWGIGFDFLWNPPPLNGPQFPLWMFPLWTGTIALFSSILLFRPTFELWSEPILWVMYRVRAAGPGLREVPLRGPCLVIANHACWFDPFILAKVLPRPVTPMMTSRFYDLPVMSWFMRRVFRTIRVPEKRLKQDVPEEIQQAIAALDRGECIVMFPEGFLRRSEEKPLKRFGRGVWQILSARPETPIVCCWIEGGWGSYASYYNGPPTKNKRPDFRRPIGVAVGKPLLIDPDLLGSHLRTRLELMNRVAAARRHLDLPDLPRFEIPEREGENNDDPPAVGAQ